MEQDSVIYLKLKDFEILLKSEVLENKLESTKVIFIENNESTLYPPLSVGVEIPYRAVFFPYMKDILKFRKVEELRLQDLFLTDLLDDFSQLQGLKKLELCFSLSANNNVNHIINVLSKLKSLQELDLNHSRLTSENRALIKKELTKSGVTMNDWLFFD